MTNYYAIPQATGACALLRIEGEHVAEQAWMSITAEHYATLADSPRGVRIVNGVPQANPPKAIRVIPRGVFMRRI